MRIPRRWRLHKTLAAACAQPAQKAEVRARRVREIRSDRSLFLQSRPIATVAVALVIGLAAESLALPTTVPAELDLGDQYRLVFVTSGTQAAEATLAFLDAFVQAQANAEAALQGVTWQVIGTTWATRSTLLSARDHTGTANYPGLPIYLLNGTMFAGSYADLWDGAVLTPLNIDQHGAEVPPSIVWTGSTFDGAGAPWELEFDCQMPLGSDCPRFFGPWAGTGRTDRTDSGWISTGSRDVVEHHRFYAISEVLTVPIPETSTGRSSRSA